MGLAVSIFETTIFSYGYQRSRPPLFIPRDDHLTYFYDEVWGRDQNVGRLIITVDIALNII